jgi:hypothetical protein
VSGYCNPIRAPERLAARLIAAATLALALAAAPTAFAQQYAADVTQSQALTSYLRAHRLPLVGAQVLKNADGGERLMLYGFVATNYGKSDAQRKALDFLHASGIEVQNRIAVRPEIAKMKAPPAASGEAAAAPGGESLDGVLDDIARYGVKGAPDESGSGAP